MVPLKTQWLFHRGQYTILKPPPEVYVEGCATEGQLWYHRLFANMVISQELTYNAEARKEETVHLRGTVLQMGSGDSKVYKWSLGLPEVHSMKQRGREIL